jgi:nitrogen regulatory protein PII
MCEKAMNIKRITAIVPTYQLTNLETCLRAAGVPGMTIDSVRGFGEHANYFRSDLLRDNVQVQVFINSERCEEITEVIKQFARDEHISAGILVIENIDRLIDLNTGQDILANHL